MFQIIPAVDVLDGKVVRLLHGKYDHVTVYSEDPVAQAKEWVDQGADLVHVVDLEGARTGSPNRGLWERLGRGEIPFQIGGGIRTSKMAIEALEAGASRVVLGTAAVWNPEILAEIGSLDRVVAAVDVTKDGKAKGQGWLDAGKSLGEVIDGLAANGVVRALVTGIGRDGTMEGPEAELTRRVIEDGRLAVIASGGVGTLGDLGPIAALGAEAVIVGRALYESRFTVADAIALFRED